MEALENLQIIHNKKFFFFKKRTRFNKAGTIIRANFKNVEANKTFFWLTIVHETSSDDFILCFVGQVSKNILTHITQDDKKMVKHNFISPHYSTYKSISLYVNIQGIKMNVLLFLFSK